MNHYNTLKIEPTPNKMLIRAAYVARLKECHPDHGGNIDEFTAVKEAYDVLVNQHMTTDVIMSSVKLSLYDMLNGCKATMLMNIDEIEVIVEFNVPPFTYPGSFIEFSNNYLTYRKIRVKVSESIDTDFTRIDSCIVFSKDIEEQTALEGTSLEIVNFDNKIHYINIPQNTSADKLVYNIPHNGFFKKNTTIRDNLTIIVNIRK